jgi:hypothetical protein
MKLSLAVAFVISMLVAPGLALAQAPLGKTLVAQFRANHTVCKAANQCTTAKVDGNINVYFGRSEQKLGQWRRLNDGGMSMWRSAGNGYVYTLRGSTGVDVTTRFTLVGNSCSIVMSVDAAKLGRATTTKVDVGRCQIVNGRLER